MRRARVKCSSSIRRTGPALASHRKDAAWEPDFYAVESVNGDADGLIEALLALGENYAAQALDRFLAHPEELTEDDRLDLAFFVGMQEQRGPGFLTELKTRMEESATITRRFGSRTSDD